MAPYGCTFRHVGHSQPNRQNTCIMYGSASDLCVAYCIPSCQQQFARLLLLCAIKPAKAASACMDTCHCSEECQQACEGCSCMHGKLHQGGVSCSSNPDSLVMHVAGVSCWPMPVHRLLSGCQASWARREGPITSPGQMWLLQLLSTALRLGVWSVASTLASTTPRAGARL